MEPEPLLGIQESMSYRYFQMRFLQKRYVCYQGFRDVLRNILLRATIRLMHAWGERMGQSVLYVTLGTFFGVVGIRLPCTVSTA